MMDKNNLTCTPVSVSCKTPGDAEYRALGRDELTYTFNDMGGSGAANAPKQYRVHFQNVGTEPWYGVISLTVRRDYTDGRFFLPAFLYGRNRGEYPMRSDAKWFARLRPGKVEIPYSPYWMVRSDRLSHPVSICFAQNRMIGISVSPYMVNQSGELAGWTPSEDGSFAQFNGFSCSISDDGLSVGCTIGYEQAPGNYIDGQIVIPWTFDSKNYLCIQPGQQAAFDLYLYDFAAENETAIHRIIEDVYRRFHQPPRLGATFDETVSDISAAIFQDAFLDEQKNYSTMISYQDGVVQRQPHTSISWTGGVEIAVPLLMAALRTGHQEMREQAVSCIQNIVDHSWNPDASLPFDSYADGVWTTNGWWAHLLENRGHSSYVVGEAVYYILKGYQYEKELKQMEHADWLEFARKTVCQMEKTKQNLEYPYIFSEKDGSGIEYDSFAGCWCLAARCMLGKITANTDILTDCLKTEKYYYHHFVERAECYGTPMDTYKAVDSEGILAYIHAVRILHESLGGDELLEHLCVALKYEFSFKFAYNVPIQVQPLSRIGWSSSGGSVTSTANPHIHPMSNSVLEDILYCYCQTQDEYYQSRLLDTLYWGMQTYSRFDGEYDFGKKGWMSERFCYCDGLLCEKYPDGSPSSTWFYFLPWGAANILEGMCGEFYPEKNLFERQ